MLKRSAEDNIETVAKKPTETFAAKQDRLAKMSWNKSGKMKRLDIVKFVEELSRIAPSDCLKKLYSKNAVKLAANIESKYCGEHLTCSCGTLGCIKTLANCQITWGKAQGLFPQKSRCVVGSIQKNSESNVEANKAVCFLLQ